MVTEKETLEETQRNLLQMSILYLEHLDMEVISPEKLEICLRIHLDMSYELPARSVLVIHNSSLYLNIQRESNRFISDQLYISNMQS